MTEQPLDFAPSPEGLKINIYDFSKEIDKYHMCCDKSISLYFVGISCKASRDFFKRFVR